MNKIFLYSKVVALAFCGMAFSSCSDFLDQEPDDRTHIDTEEKVRQMLVYAYPTANYGWIGEVSSDNFMDNNAPHLPISSSAEQIVARYNLGSFGREDDELFRFEPCVSSESQDTPSYVWQSFYESIFTVNEALEALENIKAETGTETELMKQLRAEALLIRAYDHFVLVNLFSQAFKTAELSRADQGVPYVTRASHDFTMPYDRGNVTQVYEMIEQDLEEGLKYVSDANYKVPIYHFNVRAAHAFAARFYLFYKKYDKVLEHANFVLGEPGDPALGQKLARYDGFSSCTYMDDYVHVYTDANDVNNIMLLNTMSWMSRHGLGYRYAHNSLCVREAYYHTTPWNGRYYAYPFIWMGGWTFWTGNDYGYYSAKAGEEFEYTDKLAKIGYGHIIRREFTCMALLLERAEAEIMKGQYATAVQDLIDYNHALQTFTEADYKSAVAVGMRDMTPADIDYFTPKTNSAGDTVLNYNCYANWNFTPGKINAQAMGFNIPDEAVPYMNWLNEFRRLETCWEGTRFFDLKRFGMEWSHTFWDNELAGTDKSVTIHLAWNDPRRAIEIPQDAIVAGLDPSRPVEKISNEAQFVMRTYSDFVREEESYRQNEN